MAEVEIDHLALGDAFELFAQIFLVGCPEHKKLIPTPFPSPYACRTVTRADTGLISPLDWGRGSSGASSPSGEGPPPEDRQPVAGMEGG